MRLVISFVSTLYCAIVQSLISTSKHIMTNILNETTEDEGTGFPIPFTLDELKQDILETMLALINQTRFTFFREEGTDATLWPLLTNKPNGEDPSDYVNPENCAKELNLVFSDIEGIEMVKSLVSLYNYGMLGLTDEWMNEMDDCDGPGNWASRILFDLHRSTFLEDWVAYRSINVQPSVARCLLVAELANARLMLEGARDGFFLGMQNNALDIRQMSLLAGMTEGSIRTLAGPNRKNALITTKNATGTGVHIEIENAKAWLKSKGRYVPIKRTTARGAEDFTNRKFTSYSEFQNAVFERTRFLNLQRGEDVIDARLIEAGIKAPLSAPESEQVRMDFLSEDRLLDTELMLRMGEAMELPKERFALRAAEVVAIERLAEIEQRLKQIQQSK